VQYPGAIVTGGSAGIAATLAFLVAAGFLGVAHVVPGRGSGGRTSMFGDLPLAAIAMIGGSLLTAAAPAPTVIDTPRPAAASAGPAVQG
jgi:hypothetical protein